MGSDRYLIRPVLGSFLLILAGLLGGNATVCAETPQVSIQDFENGTYHVEGYFTVQSSSETAWNVLTDYENIPHFVSSIRSSRVQRRDTTHTLLEQQSIGRVFFLSRIIRLSLLVQENAGEGITFKDLSRKDFYFYRGFWKIEEIAGGVGVSYVLEARRKFKIPDFLMRGALQKGAEELLGEVQAEINRRTDDSKEKTL